VADPEEARRRYSGVAAKRFDNGEWVFGVCRDSHAYRDGGTVVIKDSTGAVRAFFGHVCGGHFLEGGLRDAKSLAEFSGPDWWTTFGFSEHPFP
jgi:hypothetical protein